MSCTTLVGADVVAAHSHDPEWVVFDCRFDLVRPDAGRQAFNSAHIPGAHYLHLDDVLSAPKGPHSGRHPLPDPDVLARHLGHAGVSSATQVVAYDDAGGAIAARLWWLLKWLGHESVAVLDGGFARWREMGYGVSDRPPTPRAATFLANPKADMQVDAERLMAAQRGGGLVVDARAPERFSGAVEPIDAVAGHIPNAINMPFTGNLTTAGTFHSPDVLRQRFLDALGEVGTDQVIHMCGSGVTACHNLLAMAVAGLHGAKLYPGSWSEWIKDPSRPVALGSETKHQVYP